MEDSGERGAPTGSAHWAPDSQSGNPPTSAHRKCGLAGPAWTFGKIDDRGMKTRFSALPLSYRTFAQAGFEPATSPLALDNAPSSGRRNCELAKNSAGKSSASGLPGTEERRRLSGCHRCGLAGPRLSDYRGRSRWEGYTECRPGVSFLRAAGFWVGGTRCRWLSRGGDETYSSDEWMRAPRVAGLSLYRLSYVPLRERQESNLRPKA